MTVLAHALASAVAPSPPAPEPERWRVPGGGVRGVLVLASLGVAVLTAAYVLAHSTGWTG